MTTPLPSGPALSRRQFWGALAALVLIFLLVAGPVWRNPWDVDVSILASYVPIPFVVAWLLRRNGRLRLSSFLLYTVEITCAKFMITACILIALWTASSGPPRLGQAFGPTARASSARQERPPVPATPLGPTRSLEGTLVDAAGAPVPGGFVFVARGLEAFAFAPSPAAVSLVNDGRGFSPRRAVVARGQRVSVQSLDHQLHTLRAAWEGGAWLRNVPVLGSGAPSTLEISEGGELLTMRCTVHAEEPPSTLRVIHAPFIAVTDAAGRFSLAGVPAVPVTLEAEGAGGRGRADVTGQVTALTLQLHPGAAVNTPAGQDPG